MWAGSSESPVGRLLRVFAVHRTRGLELAVWAWMAVMEQLG